MSDEQPYGSVISDKLPQCGKEIQRLYDHHSVARVYMKQECAFQNQARQGARGKPEGVYFDVNDEQAVTATKRCDAYTIIIASPKLKNLYLSATAVL